MFIALLSALHYWEKKTPESLGSVSEDQKWDALLLYQPASVAVLPSFTAELNKAALYCIAEWNTTVRMWNSIWDFILVDPEVVLLLIQYQYFKIKTSCFWTWIK